MQLDVTYLHKHSFAPSATSSSTLRQELVDAEIAVRQKRPGTLVGTETPSFPHFRDAALHGIVLKEGAAVAKKQEKRNRYNVSRPNTLVTIEGFDISVKVKDIPEPPNVLYSKNYKDLTDDWTSIDGPGTLVINDVRVPLCGWDKVYKGHWPKVWEAWKGRWRKWRVWHRIIWHGKQC
jgi:hypothetical protein